MKIAILILIHEYTEQQKNLLQNLSKDFDIFIHIDKKSKINIDDIKINNTFVFKIYNVYWGSYNQILATLYLFNIANKNNYDRYIFISGADIPLKSNKYIKDFFDHNTKEYFDFTQLPKQEWKKDNYGFDRLDFFHFNVLRKKKPSILKYITSKLLNGVNEKIIIRLLKIFHIRRKRLNIDYFGGANWMDLTGNCVSQIINFINSHQEFLKKFRFTRCADEIFFQTIILNFVKNIEIEKNCLRFVDMETGPESPRILRKIDYNRLKNSSALFARKFNSNIDNEIINMIFNDIDYN